MDTFDQIVAGVELEPLAVTLVRSCLQDCWDERHPDGAGRGFAHAVIDEVVDDLRVNFGWGVFDEFVVAEALRER